LSGTVQTTILNNVLGAAGGINLSVDNNLLLYTYDVSEFENANYRQLNTNLFLYNFSTGERSNISFNKAAGTNDLDPRFSPNESKVIMVNTSNDGISNKQIYLLDISGESREMIIDHSFMPDWE
jgi:Tol biopolymer transport system component